MPTEHQTDSQEPSITATASLSAVERTGERPTPSFQPRREISGLDRIDIHMEVPRPRKEALRPGSPEEISAAVAGPVEAARTRQTERQVKPNAVLAGAEIKKFCRLNARDQEILD